MKTILVGGLKRPDYVQWINEANSKQYGKVQYFVQLNSVQSNPTRRDWIIFAKIVPMKPFIQIQDEEDMFSFFKKIDSELLPEKYKPKLFQEMEPIDAMYIPAHYITGSVQMNHNCSKGCGYSHQMVDKKPVVMGIHHNNTKQFILNTAM